MKKFFTLILVCFATVSLWAQTFQSGDLHYRVINSSQKTVEVTYQVRSNEMNYAGLTTITIPETVDYNGTTYSVTSIGSEAFRYCSSLTAVTIPNSVTSIGNSAFYNCSALTSVTIGNSVTSIGNYAFQNCSALTRTEYTGDIEGWCKISFGDSYANPTNYSKNLYIDGKLLTNLVIPESITNIKGYAFYDNDALTSITIPNSVTSIESCAFFGCSSLTSVTIPNSVTSIGSYAFQSCLALTSVTIGNSVTSIGNYAFQYCSALTSVTIGNSVTSIGNYAFQYCSALTRTEYTGDIEGWCKISFGNSDANPTNYSKNLYIDGKPLTNLVIPESITNIKNYAFYNNDALTSITIPNSVTSIGYDAFYSCSSLTAVTIPNSVTSIRSSAFYACSSLKSVTYNAKHLADIASADAAPFYNIRSQITSFTLGDEVETIPAFLCYGMSNLLSLSIPESVTEIKDYAFAEIPDLNIYVNNETPAIIGSQVVNNATQHFFVPNTTTYLSEWKDYEKHIVSQSNAIIDVTVSALSNTSALYKAIGLETVGQVAKLKIRGTINSYDIMMIRNQMPLLRELDLSEASIVANTYEYTDGYCSKSDTLTAQSFTGTGTKIATIILPNSLKYIEAGAFNTYLRELTIHNGRLATSAFRDLTKLHTVQLSDAITRIPQDAFYGCSALYAITLPETLDTIGNYAFQGAGLRAITIPANVSSLGVGAFAGGNGSSGYGYYSSATTSSQSSYYATSNYTSSSSTKYYYNYGGSLREVTIPKESKLKTIPSRAFEGNESLTKLSILGDSITSIADVAFRRCALDTLILPPNLTSLSTLSFGHCTGLKFIAMPNSLTKIPANAFVGCTNLNDIQFPRKLTHIGHHAFADCSKLSNVDIPGLVTSIGDYAFKDCNVNSVYSYLFDPFTIGQNTFSAYANANATLYIPNLEDTEVKYLFDTQWSQFLNRVRMDKSFEYDDFYANGDVVIGDKDDPLNGDPNANLNPGSGLVVEGDSIQNLGTVIINGETGDWASIIAGCNLNVDTLVLKFKVSGHQWYFFGFPFEIKISDILADGNFVIYEYDGGIRAERDTTGWSKLPDTQTCLYPGHGYIFQFDFVVDGYFSIKLNKPNFCKLVEFINLFIYPSSKPNNQNWNYVSNPLLAYFDINDLNYYGPITIWDVLSGTYQTYRPGDDEYYLSPYEAFFLQNTNLTDDFALFFDKTKAMTKKQRDERINAKKQMPIKKSEESVSERSLINLIISDGAYTDQTRVVINPNASMNYELGVDAAKFLSTEKVPQLFSYDATHAMCAINERPMDNGTVQLGIQLPKAGTYSISAARMDTTFYLFDRQENITHDFQQGDYYFDAKSGLDEQRFELVRSPKHVTTDLENTTNTTITPTSEGLVIDGNGYIQIYSMTGVLMAEGQLSGVVQLPHGVYVVVCNGMATKHTVQ